MKRGGRKPETAGPGEAIHLCTSDVSGKMRGKAVPANRFRDGGTVRVGWTPTNVQITCFDDIADSPYGALGDLVLEVGAADPVVRLRDEDGVTEHLALGDIRNLDGTPWCCCTRSILRAALDRLQRVSGLRLRGAFEHEFHLPDGTGSAGEGFTLRGFRRHRQLCEDILAALAEGGLQPATILREFGPDQFEVTLEPAIGLAIADRAAILREVTAAVAERRGQRVSFAPLIAPGGMGNGVHVHLGLVDADGRPCSHDPARPHGMAAGTGSFIAGVLRHLPSILCLLAPSVVSYARLVPHRWSAAWTNLGRQDREAAIRLTPVRTAGGADAASQFHFEVRACDAAASPHLALAAIAHAGAAGIEAGLPAPEPTREDLSLLTEAELAARGLRRLPLDLDAALTAFAADGTATGWFPETFADIYLAHKRAEIGSLRDRSPEEVCAAYQATY